MFRIITLLAVIGIWYFHFKETKRSTLIQPPVHNIIVTFKPEQYTNITWYEIFRDYSQWEKCGKYSFRGYINKEQLKELSNKLEEELEISSEDYQIDFYQNDGQTMDYIILFENVKRPTVKSFPHLEILGRWEEYGKNNYRLWASISEEALNQALKKELNLKDDEFIIHQAGSFAWTRFL